MRWYINDLSLQEQFDSSDAFVRAFDALARMRRFAFIRTNLYFSRQELRSRPVFPGVTAAQAFYSSALRDARNRALQWIDKGPFLEEDRCTEQYDLFQYQGHDVTEQGLGEAARRTKIGQKAGSYSFPGGRLDFTVGELAVVHGFEEEPISTVIVDNASSCEELLLRALDALPKAHTWTELIQQCRERFDHLMLSEDIEEQLATEAFHESLRDNIIEMLGVLQEYKENLRPDGSRTQVGQEIYERFFVGHEPWFVDESDTNKRRFKGEMTFRDPAARARRIVAFWHGRIQMRQFRIHFEWPVPIGQNVLKVFYIGRKISRD